MAHGYKKIPTTLAQFRDADGIIANKLSIISFPINFLVDKTGKIIARNIEPMELEKFLQLN